MSFQVFVLADAEQDLIDIINYLKTNGSIELAEKTLGELETVINSLSNLPMRGHLPPELKRINISMYKEIHCKPYRIVYEIDGEKVYIFAILDNRRDIEDTLMLRLLR